MNEKERQTIREQLDQAPIPERLLPKQIEKQLKELPKKNPINYKTLTAAAAAILLLACAIPLLTHMPSLELLKSDSETTSPQDTRLPIQQSDPSQAKAENPYAAQMAQNYSQVYNKLVKRTDYQTGLAGSIPENRLTKEEASADSAPALGSAKNAAANATQTNTQVANVDEADVLKSDGSFLYLIDRDTLKIMKPSKAKGLTTVFTTTAIDPENQLNEFYLNGHTLTLMETAYRDTMSTYVKVRVYDILDPANPKLLCTVSQDGSYQDSRMTDGFLYLITSYYIYEETDANKPATFVPKVNEQTLPANRILLPEESNGTMYTVISSLDTSKPAQFQDQIGILSDSSECYASAENLYLTSAQYQTGKSNADFTRITKLHYSKGTITNQASGTVPGTVNDQFSLDEEDGYFRIFTTVHYNNGDTKNILYILDQNLQKYSSLGPLAPGETIQSARFLGKTAYVVTFRQTDPLFSIDLSDPAKPVLLGKLKIPGFSEYLHPFSDKLLLGIGYETDSSGQQIGLKLSMFDCSNPADVKERNKLVLKNYSYSSLFENHKNIMLDLANHRFGLTANGSDDQNSDYYQDYLIYQYDPKKGFTKEFKVRVSDDAMGTDNYDTRGIIIGDRLYVIASGDCIRIYQTKNYELLDTVRLQ